MAKVEVEDIQVGATGSTGSTSGTFRSQIEVGRAVEGFSANVSRAADVAMGVALKLQQNFNERKTNEAELRYRAVRHDLLVGEDGLLRRLGRDAEGNTANGSQALSDYVEKVSPELPNDVVRQSFRRMAGKDIANTIDYLARDEATKLERVRQTDSLAIHQNILDNLVSSQPDAFANNDVPDGPLNAAMDASRMKLGAAHPDQGDAAIERLVQQEYAEGAAAAVYKLMDQNAADNRGTAEAIAGLWGKEWDVQTQLSVRDEIRNQVSLDILEPIVQASIVSGQSAREATQMATDMMREHYERNEWGDVPPEVLKITRTRALAEHALLEQENDDRKIEERSQHLISLHENIQKPGATREEVFEAYMTTLKKATANNDLELYENAQDLYANFNAATSPETASTWPKQTTQKGFDILAKNTRASSRADAIAAVPYMKQTDWDEYAADVVGRSSEMVPEDELEEALNYGRNLTTGNGPYPTTATGDKTGEYLSANLALKGLVREFRKQNERLPNPDELNNMSVAASYNLNDPYRPDTGASGRLLDFLLDPTADPLNPSDPRDKFVLNLAVNAGTRDPKRHAILQADLERRGVKSQKITVEALAENPELAAKLITLGITNNTPAHAADLQTFGTVNRLATEAKKDRP